jgi:hypothetical protein
VAKEAPEEALLPGGLLPGDPIKTARQRAETALDLDSPDSGIIGLWSLFFLLKDLDGLFPIYY